MVSNIMELIAMRLLLIEDDTKIASFVKKGLEEAGLAVDHAADGEDCLPAIWHAF